MKMTFKGRRPPKEDDLQSKTTSKILEMKKSSNGKKFQILKVEYLSNHWTDLTQILYLSSGDQKKKTVSSDGGSSFSGIRPQNILSGISQ